MKNCFVETVSWHMQYVGNIKINGESFLHQIAHMGRKYPPYNWSHLWLNSFIHYHSVECIHTILVTGGTLKGAGIRKGHLWDFWIEIV